MSERFLAACLQLTSREVVRENLATCARLCAEARQRGAALAVLPENFAFLGRHELDKLALAEVLDDARPGPILAALQQIARTEKLWLVAGGMAERSESPDKVHNTLVALSPEGRLVTRYRKIHLFDVDIPGGAQFKESGTVAPGDEPTLLETPWARVGLSICYDLRFPELFRGYALAGAAMTFLPSEWPKPRLVHWQTLVRARAIENQMFVFACNRVGSDPSNEFFGHSMAVDPWGEILAEGGEGEELITLTADLSKVQETRRKIPILEDRRAESYW